jgi:DNA-binding winged helix-turn-helix (wHTH) protein
MPTSFGPFTLDRATRELRRGREVRHLEPKAFELLVLLVERRPAAVSKQEIRDCLWPDTFVSESTLTSLVAQVRQALGDAPRRTQYVRTVHGFGYAFSSEVGEEEARRPEALPRRAPRVEWEGRALPLEPGENILGRDDDVGLCIDARGVSRRHARIVVDGGRFTLEDLGSKNGTFLHDLRLNEPAGLRDGDAFHLGRTRLVFHSSGWAGPTDTEESP